MRGLMALVAVMLVACLAIAAALLVATGRSFIYASGIGANARLGHLLPWSALIFGAGAGIGALLHAAASEFPRQYYQLMWWRDASWLACLVAALVGTVVYVGTLLTYGAL
jgi:hypothetical protein